LDTDASHESIGAVLSQVQNGEEKVIAYASHKLTKCEKGYCITRKELLAVYKYVMQFKHYLLGRRFTVRTDHQALVWLLNWTKPSTSQYCTWIAELECYDMEVKHRPGQAHSNADALSRIPQCEQCELKHLDPQKRRNVKILQEQREEEPERIICKLRNMSNAWPQEEDEVLRTVLNLMKAGRISEKRPKELNNAPEEAKSLWTRRNQLCIRGGLLHYKTVNDKYMVVVPREKRKQLISTTHQVLGHVGITKCAEALRRDYYWPGMELEVRLTINSCKWCQQRKCVNVGQQPERQTTIVGFPFAKIALDITGPLPPSRNGYRYILGIIDYFSKFPMLVPLRTTDAKTVASAVYRRWISVFGAPYSIHTDRGTSFESDLFRELCNTMGIQKTKTAPYYPQSDGLIERLFRTTKDMIFSTMRTYNTEWCEVLPVVEMGLRGTVQSTTKVAPFEVLFGRSMRLPTSWMYPDDRERRQLTAGVEPEEDTRCPLSEYVLSLRNQIQTLWQEMRRQQKIQRPDEKQTKKSKENGFAVGTCVMARILPVEKGIDIPRFAGPYNITRKLGEWTYELTHVATRKKIQRNHHHLKPCFSQTEPNEEPTRTQPGACPGKTNQDPTRTKPGASPARSQRQRNFPDRYGFPRRGEV